MYNEYSNDIFEAPAKEQNELQSKVEKYESVLEEFLAEKKEIHTIQAGPFEQNGANYYRVNGAVMFANKEPFFGNPIMEVLKPGTEVICIGSAIIATVPKQLEKVTELPQFNLIDWNQVGGLKSQLSHIRESIELPINNDKLARELGLGAFPGLLLWGPPGCGKTLIAKAIASTILGTTKADPAAFTYVKGAEMLDKFIGETEHRIANMFTVSREYCKRTGKRGVVFIDEAEALLRRRGSGKSSDVEMTTVPTFLAEMDGLDKDHNPIFILSTNLPNALDEAITREGRIDLKIEVTRPNQTDAVEIFQIHLKKVKCCDDIDEMSQKGADMIFSSACKDKVSGAMIQAVSQAAARKALNRIISNKKSPRGVILTDLEESVKMINSSYAK